MVGITQSPLTGRGRGRPVGSDSAVTRKAILRAARAVINERGYEAATFQAIAVSAGISRPTMHYYFTTKQEIYDSLHREAYSVVSAAIEAAKLEGTLTKQLTAFTAAARALDCPHGSMMQFLITSRLEQHRHPGLRSSCAPVADAVTGFFTWMVGDAIGRGELGEDVDGPAVANLLSATFWGVTLFGGYLDGSGGISAIGRQLNSLFCRGLLQQSPVPVPVSANRLAV
ncbi:TetR/AcrR family transcriptional regulator [Mycolicibacterium celeriflavum]|uniref:TetR/AcrR family transcriptional regulator n=1 Tax=Mycolicibacterium celeriflavum TaxID=1249101 RepID=UPI0013F4D365|nr:TetR/AcrR family transcriptional regulator [Mycolicibacterium celeriflavum]